ncbi:MAG TPA: right-handed parallel beta-helix repeat-containing protein [Phycisphaerae bacterium]|nr:right-handed parallel beta-helix repeat-containing protein [Phycisphaerae bacterium]
MRLALAFLAVLIFAVAVPARDIYVAKNGNNGNSGGSADPYLTIKYAISQSTSGDVIHVRAGTYAEWWIVIKSGTELISEDGLYAAKIYSGTGSAIRLENDNSGIDGFEIYGDWDAGASEIDGLVRPLWSNNTWVKNCLIHDAPNDGDVIKIGADNVLIENCIIYDPAHRYDDVSYQECVDIFGDPVPNGVTVRGCWIYHTPEHGGDNLIFAKGGSKNILWENNVFGPCEGGASVDASVGCGASSPAVFPACENFIARNNIFVNCSGDGAFEFKSAKNAHVYNNIFYNYVGGRCFIQFFSTQPSGAPPQTDRNEDCYVYNNIFLQSNGYPIYQDRGRWTPGVTYIPENFGHDNNIYYLCNTSPASNDVDVTAEANSIFDNPDLVAPATPNIGSDNWASIVADFLLQDVSPAIDAGVTLPLPGQTYGVPADVLGTSRPQPAAGSFDIGIHEYAVLAALASSEPPADGTLPKNQNNVILLTFDAAITLPAGGDPALSIVPIAGGLEEGDAFTYSVEPDGVTLKAIEQGPILTDLTWYSVTPATGFNVETFTVDLCTLVGDANNSSYVTTADYVEVKAHMGQYTDARYDLNGSGRVTTADYSVVKGSLGRRAPIKN